MLQHAKDDERELIEKEMLARPDLKQILDSLKEVDSEDIVLVSLKIWKSKLFFKLKNLLYAKCFPGPSRFLGPTISGYLKLESGLSSFINYT